MRMKALQWLWPEDDLMVELEDMLAERESTQGEVAKTVKEALTSRSVRWQILTLVFPCAGVQFCGIPAVCSGLNTIADSISLVSTTASSFPAVFLHLWRLPWDRRAREPDAIPGLRCWSNRASSSYSMCKCLHKWSKRGTTKTFGGTSILSSLQSCRKMTHMKRCYLCLMLAGWTSLNTFSILLCCISVFSDRSRWQKEADGLQLSADGCHHVCPHSHIVTQGEGP